MISEIPGNWIDQIGPDGRLVFSVRAPVSYPSDPQPLPGGRWWLTGDAGLTGLTGATSPPDTCCRPASYPATGGREVVRPGAER